MKKMLHKMLSIMLAICVLLSAMPFPVSAEDVAEQAPASSIVNGSYTDGAWSEGGNGTITHNINGTDVTLSKTATPVEGQENTYDITLSVQTSTTTTTKTNSAAVVLVVDVSGSMDFCAECGIEDYHSRECKHSGEVRGNQSRRAAAQGAAYSFLSAYAGEDPNADRQLAIVFFSSGYSTQLSWCNVAGGSGNNSYNAAYSAIGNFYANGGTNLEGGLYEASGLLDSVSAYGHKSVVLLTDGAPTYRIGGGIGIWGSSENNQAAANRATQIKNKGATLYSVCFGVADEETYFNGPTVGDFLSGSVASSGCAYNANNTDELYGAFAAITESITSGLNGDGWTATDPMADMIAVSSAPANFTSPDGSNYTWTLSNADISVNGNVTTYTYTVTYRVTLDVQGLAFEEGKYFPTNGPTYLNVDGKQYAFPVPGVTGVLPRTDVSVTKEWADAENQDGIRPGSVTVQLKEGNVVIGEPVVLDASNNWTYTWTDLIEMSKGEYHVYVVEELDVPDGYKDTYPTNEDNRFALVVRNSHEVEKTEFVVTKAWEDNNDQDGIRPESVTVNLLADGQVIDSVVLSDANAWTHTFTDLDVNKSGKPITYTVEEAEVPEGYTVSVDGNVVTNTHEVEKISIPVAKIWEDNDNQDGIRPNSIVVTLYANGQSTDKTLTISSNNWTGAFTDLDKYQNGQEIVYTVVETAVNGYTSVVEGSQEDGFAITNTHTPEVISISGSKTWEDNNNQDGARPASITINLLANGKVVATKTVTANDGWAWNFENMPKFENGTAITYSITEDAVEGYTTSYNGYNVTNKHTPAETSVTVTKAWADGNNQDGIRPNDITVVLMANGQATDKTLVLSSGNNWTGSFTDLPKFEGGQEIVYTVEELSVTGYTTEIEGSAANGFTITNTHTPEVVTISGAKTWEDNNNQDGARPESITINLLANGQVVATKTVTANDGWAWTFENMPKFENGTVITYSVSEEAVEDYSTTYNGYNVTNKHTPAETSVTVSKSWVDSNNQDGIRPNDITVVLLANGQATDKTLTLNAGNNWTGSFTELPKYEGGQEIVYTVEEVTVAGYTSVIEGSAANGFTITNTHNPETIAISGEKTWADRNNQDGARPESITINLLANGQVVATKTVTEADGWAWTFENMPKFENGTAITYSITEGAVEGYTTTYNGYDVTNSYTPAEISITVTKAWADSNNQDGIRPNDITVILLANGEATENTMILSSGNNWTDSFTGLPKFEAGQEIVYTVEELEIEGYSSVITGDAANGFTITNTHNPETIEISGEKIWDDKRNQDGARPESITVNVVANGKVVATKTVTEADDWAYTFENLPKFENGGNEIVYSITEEAVEGYSTTYDGYDITNSYTPQQISITVSKAWEDANDQDGIRPDEITVILLADGQTTDKTLTLSADGNWTGSFTELDKFANGTEIVYTIEEIEIEGYTTVITGTIADGFVITNSHTPETVEIAGGKTWDDGNNQDGARPESITINLLANGQVVASKTVTAEDEWVWNFENMPKYANGGTEIIYTITEDAVEGYSAVIDGYNVTNSYTPAEITINVTKAWVDSNNAEGLRPDEVTILLFANGKDTGLTLVLSAENKWTGAFENLPKFAGGEAIEYMVYEKEVKNYHAVVRGTAEDGFTVTNSHNYIPQTGDERTPMLWVSMMAVSVLVMVLAGTSFLTKKKRNTAK